jgi:hypothetical protein
MAMELVGVGIGTLVAESSAVIPSGISRREEIPRPEAKSYLLALGKDKDAYASFIGRTHINLGRLLQRGC